jgi:hypothetical protein
MSFWEKIMGVDFYSCELCGEVFPDCGAYGHCTGCEATLCEGCRDKMVDKYGAYDEEDGCYSSYDPLFCNDCHISVVHDKDIMEYLLRKLALSREDVEKSILRKRGALK